MHHSPLSITFIHSSIHSSTTMFQILSRSHGEPPTSSCSNQFTLYHFHASNTTFIIYFISFQQIITSEPPRSSCITQHYSLHYFHASILNQIISFLKYQSYLLYQAACIIQDHSLQYCYTPA